MSAPAEAATSVASRAAALGADWLQGDADLYLGRCQIDTPADLVAETWRRVRKMRPRYGKVIDFGAGDGRFARGGDYGSYTGYEVDSGRMAGVDLPGDSTLEHRCAFSTLIDDADLCIGNPPFVRNQDLPTGWRTQVAEKLATRSGVSLSGLANAWQYFFLLSLLSTAADGVCALVIPYEWVSRPSVEALRRFIRASGWRVDVYRLSDRCFDAVLTTASITIVDKRGRDGRWRFLDTDAEGSEQPMRSTSGSPEGHIDYARVARGKAPPRAIRGLSPGTQKVFVLTEGERARLGLKPGLDVRRCATSLRHLPRDLRDLDVSTFDRHFRAAGVRCWLINPRQARQAGPLRDYLDSVQTAAYATATCMARDTWWDFKMPDTPAALIATCFKGGTPKAMLNSSGLIAVGGVAGLHGMSAIEAAGFVSDVAARDLRTRVVAHAKGLMKLEIGQINTLISEHAASRAGR